MNNAIQTIVLLCCACSLLASKAVSVPREGVTVSAATPAAVQVESDASPAVTTTVATAPEPEAVSTGAVSYEQPAPAPPLAPARVSVQAAAPGPAYSQGRYVLTSQPVYGRFGRVVGSRPVWVWQGASYRYQRPVYYRYSNCANGRCN